MNPEFETESLAGLNAAQREAVLHFEGPMLVLAGAGSGKTRVLTTRIARLVEHHGVDPTRILAVTFTNKAAGEMRDRISRLLGHEPKGMWCGTFHAIGARLLRANAVTFDDLLTLPVQLLSGDEGLRRRLGSRFQFILVDEYQDTNRAQYQFIKLLGAEHSNVVVVGDDDQSIYGWRGADIRNILDFEREFPNARVVRLEENYRSTPNILEVANAAISANVGRKGKTLRPTRPAG